LQNHFYMFRLLLKIFTAIASRITPKNLRTTISPALPNIRSIHFNDRSTRKMITRLIRIPAMILYSPKFAFNDMIVVKVPDPAISGNAIGTTLPVLLSASVLLKNSIPSIISSPITKITIEPATAKECTSTLISFRKGSPTSKKPTMRNPEARVALPASICPSFSFREISTGIDPTISITAKRVNVIARIWSRLNMLVDIFYTNIIYYVNGHSMLKKLLIDHLFPFFVSVVWDLL